ncbi:MAG: hypothetical protein ACQETI_03970 [Halobacteriota archaeon]
MSTVRNRSVIEHRRAFQDVTDLIGRAWLESGVETYVDESSSGDAHIDARTPTLVEQYYRASVDLGVRDGDSPESPALESACTETRRYLALGSAIGRLDSAGVVSQTGTLLERTPTDLLAPRLREPASFEKTAFECLVASAYAGDGHDVYFVEGDRVRSPDVWIPSRDVDLHLVCRRCSDLRRGTRDRDVCEWLVEELASVVQTGCIVHVELERWPSVEEANRVREAFPTEFDAGTETTITTPFGTIFVFSYLGRGDRKRIPFAGTPASRQLAFFYRLNVKPILSVKLDGGVELQSDFVSTALVPSAVRASGRHVTYSEPTWVSVRKVASATRLRPLVAAFEETREKFGRNTLNVLHVFAPNLHQWERPALETLRRSLGEQLNTNPHVAAVVLGTEVVDQRVGDNRLRLATGVERNHSPIVDVPESIDLPGESVETFIADLASR